MIFPINPDLPGIGSHGSRGLNGSQEGLIGYRQSKCLYLTTLEISDY